VRQEGEEVDARTTVLCREKRPDSSDDRKKIHFKPACFKRTWRKEGKMRPKGKELLPRGTALKALADHATGRKGGDARKSNPTLRNLHTQFVYLSGVDDLRQLDLPRTTKIPRPHPLGKKIRRPRKLSRLTRGSGTILQEIRVEKRGPCFLGGVSNTSYKKNSKGNYHTNGGEVIQRKPPSSGKKG